MPDINDFLAILRAIVVHHSPAELCGRLNSFIVVDQMTQLNADNAGVKFKDYAKGHFWSRDWFNQGASPNDIKKQYDALVVRAMSVEPYREDTESKKWVYPLHLNVVGQIQCDYCPDGCDDTLAGRRLEVAKTLQHVIDEMQTYQQYSIVPAAGDPFTGWASTAQVTALVENGTWTSAEFNGKRLTNYIQNQTFDCFIPDWSSLNRINRRVTEKDSLLDNVVAIATVIYFEVCDATTPFGFDYETHSIQELGVVRCAC